MSIESILYEWSYMTLFGVTILYFLFLYFGIGPFFLWCCKTLHKRNLLNVISTKVVPKGQTTFEIKNSLVSILVFGFSTPPIVFLIRQDIISLLPNTAINILIGIIILNVWNEVHFFIVHRLMHLPYFMKKIHYIHHKSTVPSVYSVYSFHWFEAFLLSTVPLIIAVFVPFASLAFFLYPITSILLNYAGHCNYRFGNGHGKSWKLFGTAHNEHHSKGRKNYGFASNLLDQFSVKIKKL